MLNLGPADLALIAQARQAFALDYRYLLDILWQARARLRPPDEPECEVLSEPEPEPPSRPVAHLAELEPRLLTYVIEDPSGCWTWSGSLTGAGQPVMRLGPDRKVRPVRRWVFEATYGLIPDGRRALAGDGCRPRCVHPDHVLVLPTGVHNRRQIRGRA